MDKSDCRYNLYINILKEELVPAMGCTEPICLAYAAAKAREVLGTLPNKVDILASGNIIKNVKSVIVPNTNGMKGLKASVAIGIIGGNPDKELEVIANVTAEQKQETQKRQKENEQGTGIDIVYRVQFASMKNQVSTKDKTFEG